MTKTSQTAVIDFVLDERLPAEPSLVPGAVEEALRLQPPSPGLGRMLVEGTKLAGADMPEAERVMLLFGAANRDASVFDDPVQFKIDRVDNRHLTFGVGTHRCVGAPLARLEMRLVLEEVLRRKPGVRLEIDDHVSVDYHLSRLHEAAGRVVTAAMTQITTMWRHS